MRFLVTGGAGFIGSHVVDYLLERGIPVTVWDDLSSGYIKNISENLPYIKFIEASLSDQRAAIEAFHEVTHVIHLAAQISVPKSWDVVSETLETNTRDTVLLLERCRRQPNFKGLAFASTCAVYGNTSTFPTLESTPTIASSPYAVSKKSAEDYLELYRDAYNLPAVTFRFFNVFGPRQRRGSAYASVISEFSTRLLRGEPIYIHGDGNQTRDFIYVKDVAKLLVEFSLKGHDLKGLYNMCFGEERSIVQILDLLEKEMGTKAVRLLKEERANDIKRSLGSNLRLREACKKERIEWSSTPFELAISQSLAWYQQEEQLWEQKRQYIVH